MTAAAVHLQDFLVDEEVARRGQSGARCGRIWIGPLLPAGDIDVPGLLARFSRAHPDVEVGLREGVAADMLRFLAADELDVAFSLLAGEPPTSSPSSD